MRPCNQTGTLMMRGCRKKGRVREAETQSKHGISSGRGAISSVRFRENSLPLDRHGASQIAWEAQRKESSFTPFYKAKESFIF